MPKSELCFITIVFPVASDEVAIAIKRKMQEIIEPIPDARIEFRLGPLPDGVRK